ncbi:MAG: glycoside hydrolase family 127 protein [Bacteroidales bacterium]|nr:glycoside hydrolase family 127 protein [Bacteroidales bacterium]
MVLLALAVSCGKPSVEKLPADGLQAPYGVYSEGWIGQITPQGWIKEFLERQRTGLTGHPEALCYPYNTCLWDGEITRETEEHGDDWWRYEQTAYYTDGLLRLGYLLGDEALVQKGKAGIHYTLNHLTEDGSYGFRERSGEPEGVNVARDIAAGKWLLIWPQAVFFRAIQAYYEKTGDPAIPAALERHFLNFKGSNYGSTRNIVNVEGLLWTYGMTGQQRLLELAEEGWKDGHFELNEKTCLSDKPFFLHGVSVCEELKVPMILYAWTGNPHYRDLALRVEQKLEDEAMLPDGIPSSAEHLAGRVANHSHETCNITDFSWSMGYYLMTTGQAKWGDRIERAVFNAGPGAVGKDFKTLQYFSSVNQFISTGTSNNNETMKGKTWMQYRPVHETECCAGNVHRFMPNYVSRMWLRSSDGGAVAALLGPSDLTLPLSDGVSCTIEEQTCYPFEDEISFRFSFRRADGKTVRKQYQFPFQFRIPEWAEEVQVEFNGHPLTFERTEGGFARVVRPFRSGDVIRVSFGCRIETPEFAGQGRYVERGPLLYAYSIPTRTTQDTVTYANIHGRVSAHPDFKCWSKVPVGPWNYALKDAAADGWKVERVDIGEAFPWEEPCLKISVPVVKVKDWQLDEGNYTPENPAAPFDCDPDVTRIDLVPYGTTYLRLTVFPVAD